MVEFCGSCGTSLPKGDLTIRKGKLFTSPDYVCPNCGKVANLKGGGPEPHPCAEPTLEKDLVIRKGTASQE